MQHNVFMSNLVYTDIHCGCSLVQHLNNSSENKETDLMQTMNIVCSYMNLEL